MSDVVESDTHLRGGSPRNPLIKRLLRNYQESAKSSLEGPPTSNSCVVLTHDDVTSWDTGGGMKGGGFDAKLSGLLRAAQDPHRRRDTTLEGERISCFVVGGERRLCVPQLLQTVLSRFSLPEIHSACDSLRIHIALADDAQLTALRRDRVLPGKSVARAGNTWTRMSVRAIVRSPMNTHHLFLFLTFVKKNTLVAEHDPRQCVSAKKSCGSPSAD